MEFKGKTVIITGGSKGIGLGIASEYYDLGANVYICSRNLTNLERAKSLMPNINIAQIDCSNSQALEQYVRDIGINNGKIDILVNNVSGFGLSNDKAGFERAFYGDIMPVVVASNAALEYMTSDSAIVNISSKAADMGFDQPPYAAIKAAINNYTKSQAKLFANKGIRVNAVSPGLIEFSGGYWESVKLNDPNIYAARIKRVALKRTGTVKEIADVVLFLTSSKSKYITGTIIKVDGGHSL